ncbi:MAG TPA: NAD(P)-binding domain-containing protein [Anaerolineae bacterium]|nr:NAD(P)-binding domain-containing protein [Anaerolineae bacterium]
MKIGILGSGTVAQTLGAGLIGLGHNVKLGTRDPKKLDEWFDRVGGRGTVGSMADAAAFGEMVFNCTAGMHSLEALRSAGEENLAGKIVVDVANPLDFSAGMPPTLSVSNTDSLGEQIQRAFPEARVVKTLNTVNASLMVNPAALPGSHTVFVSGNDPDAKAEVTGLLKKGFGWPSVIDLGDITTARGTEMLLPLWVRLLGVLGTPMFNFQIVR